VHISIKKTGAGMEMRICDNGTLEAKTYKTTGSGTANMQMRAEKIGGTIQISREKGYCVVLVVSD
jgi:signal transduction histidine kinase